MDADMGDSVAHGVDVLVPDTTMVFGPLVWFPLIPTYPVGGRSQPRQPEGSRRGDSEWGINEPL